MFLIIDCTIVIVIKIINFFDSNCFGDYVDNCRWVCDYWSLINNIVIIVIINIVISICFFVDFGTYLMEF